MTDQNRERELELKKVKATREYVDEFRRQREEWKLRERQRLEEENRKILGKFSNHFYFLLAPLILFVMYFLLFGSTCAIHYFCTNK